MPEVSVVMAVRNGGCFVAEAVASILSQTLRDLELVIIDDGSTDHTPEFLAGLTDSRVVLITQPPHGLAGALNRGAAAARSTLVARMDADDVSLPDRLEKQVTFMQEHPEVALLGTAVRHINETGAVTGEWCPPLDDISIRRGLIRANLFAHPSVVFRREPFLRMGGYRDLPFAQDYDLWLRMAARHRVANLAEPLVLRRHTKGQFGSHRETQQARWALRARASAIRRGDYPLWAAGYLVKPALAAATPGPVRQAARRVLRRAA